MKDMLLLGLVALVAVVVLVLFMTGEFKNKSTSSSDGHVNHQDTEFARLSLDTNDLRKELFEDLYRDIHLGIGQSITDPLYAQGGGYDMRELPYGKYEEPEYSVGDGKSISNVNWARDFEVDEAKQKLENVGLKTMSDTHSFYSPYSPYGKDTTVLYKTPLKQLGDKWVKNEDNVLGKPALYTQKKTSSSSSSGTSSSSSSGTSSSSSSGTSS